MSPDDAPRARVRRRRSPWMAMWVVPLAAAALAAWLLYQRAAEYGPEIVVQFRDGGGLRVGQTPVQFRGVQVGEVTGVDLGRDLKSVLVRLQLRRSAANLAREGASFWIERPRASLVGGITGLNTVLTGPVIQALPGDGKRAAKFVGLEKPPTAREGLHVILLAERPRSLREGEPVYYRGVQVGTIESIDLTPNAVATAIRLVIYRRYASLVRDGSMFWNASGVNLSGGLLKGFEVQLESLRSLVFGGIAFASPDGSPAAQPGTVFTLHKGPQPRWLEWKPHLKVEPAP